MTEMRRMGFTFCRTLGCRVLLSQTWQQLMNQATVYQQKHHTLNTNLYAEKAFQKAKAEFSTSDLRYRQTLDLSVESSIQFCINLAIKGNHFTRLR